MFCCAPAATAAAGAKGPQDAKARGEHVLWLTLRATSKQYADIDYAI